MFGSRIIRTAALAGAVAFGGTAAMAQEEAPAINNGNVSLNASVDFVTEYWFRGIVQENQGLIVQPGADITLGLISEGDFSLDAYFGVWNSWHFDAPSTASDDLFWYEADFYIGVAIGLPGGFGLDLSYANLYGPNAAAEFAEEIDLSISYDDSGLWGGDFALSPYVLFATEIDAGSDGLGKAGDKGSYLEVGIEPSFTLLDSADYPLTLSVPVAVGFDLGDYYETTTGEDDDFGFFDIGAVLSMPLTCVPAEFGAWEVYAGVHYIALGDAAQDIGQTDFGVIGSDDDSVWGIFGISMSY